MLRPEILFITKLIKGDALESYIELRARGFRDAVFPNIYQPILGFIDAYVTKFKQVPSQEEITEKFPRFEADLLFDKEVPAAALGAIYEAVVRSALRGDMYDELQSVLDLYKNEEVDPFDVLARMSSVSAGLVSKFSLSSAATATFAEAATFLLDELEGRVEQPIGAAPALLFIDDQLRGWQPGELTTFTAPTGVGKTWELCLNTVTITTGNALHFYDPLTVPSDKHVPSKDERAARRRRVLFVSLEMPYQAIMRRLACLYARVSYARYRARTLSDTERDKLRTVLTYLGTDPNKSKSGSFIKVIGPDVAHTPAAIHAAALDFKADVVIIDGFYLMPGPGDERWQKVEANMQQLRLYSLLGGQHYMLASQLKRASGKSSNATDIDSLAFSSSIGHDSTNVIAMIQSKADASSNQIIFSGLKMRDGIPGLQYGYNWDHQEGIYTENGVIREDEEFTAFSQMR